MKISYSLVLSLTTLASSTSFASFKQVSSEPMTLSKECGSSHNCQIPAPLAISPSGSTVVAGPGYESGFSVLEIKNDQLITKEYQSYPVTGLGHVDLRTISFSPDSKKLAFTYADTSGSISYASTYTIGTSNSDEGFYAEGANFLRSTENRLVLSQQNFFRLYDDSASKNRQLAVYAHNYPDGYSWHVPNNINSPVVAAMDDGTLIPFKVGNLDASQTVVEPVAAKIEEFMEMGSLVELPIQTPDNVTFLNWPNKLEQLSSEPKYAPNSIYLAAINGYWFRDTVSNEGTFTKAIHLLKVEGANELALKDSVDCAPSVSGGPFDLRLKESTKVFFSADSKNLVAACGSGIALYEIANDRLNMITSTKTSDLLVAASNNTKVAIAKIRNSNALAIYSVSSTGIRRINTLSMPSEISNFEISSDESSLVVASIDGTVKMFGIIENKLLGETKVGAYPNVKFAGQDQFAVIASANDKTIRLYSVR